MSAPHPQAVADLRQRVYLTEFSKKMRELIEQGYDPAMAEREAHRDAAELIKLGDAERKGAQIAFDAAIDYGVELGQVETPFIVAEAVQEATAKQRERTQGAGAAATNAAAKMAKAWIIEQWQTRKHESRFGRMNARRGTESPPSKKTFADHMAAPGGPLEKQFPGYRITGSTAKTIAETWLKDLG